MISREEKLKKLAGKKAGSEMTIITNGEPFIAALQGKIDQLKEALGVGVEVDAYELIEQLKEIKAFTPVVSGLIESIKEIEIPAIPESIEVAGLTKIAGKFDDLFITLEKIANIKLPDIEVHVESINEKNADKVVRKLDAVISKTTKSDEANKQVISDVIAKFDVVLAAIEKKATQTKVSQKIEDYMPVRRVRYIGNRLIFDDDAYTGSNSGGASNVTNVGSTSGTTGQVSVDATADQIIPQRNGRGGVLITNLGTTDVWLGFDAGVTTGTGDLLLGTKGTAKFIPTIAAIYGVTGGGTANLSYIEVY